VLLNGSVVTIPTITPQEREELFTLARTFNEVGKMHTPKPEQEHWERVNVGDRPGDLYNARVTWEAVLEPHGWVKMYEWAGEAYWKRPDKDQGVSATTNYQNSDLLYVFSSSTLFEPERGYSKFSAYTLLNYSGDFTQAARALASWGDGARNGSQREKRLGRAQRLCREAEETARRILAKHRDEAELDREVM